MVRHWRRSWEKKGSQKAKGGDIRAQGMSTCGLLHARCYRDEREKAALGASSAGIGGRSILEFWLCKTEETTLTPQTSRH